MRLPWLRLFQAAAFKNCFAPPLDQTVTKLHLPVSSLLSVGSLRHGRNPNWPNSLMNLGKQWVIAAALLGFALTSAQAQPDFDGPPPFGPGGGRGPGGGGFGGPMGQQQTKL